MRWAWLLVLAFGAVLGAEVENGTTHGVLCVTEAEGLECNDGGHYVHQEVALSPTSFDFWLYIILSLICVITGGIMSGLTIGLFSIDPLKLQLLKFDTKGSEIDRKRADVLQPILVKHHHVLVTLLVMNATAMEALPIFLDALVPAYGAIIISVVFVLFFGEIIPQAIFSNNALQIGATFAPLVKFLMIMTFPISWPVAKLLDKLLGDEGGSHFLFGRDQLTALVEVHEAKHGGILKPEQVQLLRGAIHFGEKLVKDVMTPLSSTYRISLDRHLDFDCLEEIFKAGFSRIPVYDKTQDIVGLLIAKDLVLVNPEDNLPISTLIRLYGCPFNKVFPDMQLLDMLRLFKTSRTHLAIVHDVVDDGKSDPHNVNLGIITLEDIIQEIFEDSAPAEEMFVKEKKAHFNMLMLDSRRRLPATLSSHEIFAVYHHLVAQVPTFARAVDVLSERGVKKLLTSARVIQTTVDPKSQDFSGRQTMVEEGGLLLYAEGQPSCYFTLILDGNVEVRSGIDRFLSQHGRWSFFFTRVLEQVIPKGPSTRRHNARGSTSRAAGDHKESGSSSSSSSSSSGSSGSPASSGVGGSGSPGSSSGGSGGSGGASSGSSGGGQVAIGGVGGERRCSQDPLMGPASPEKQQTNSGPGKDLHIVIDPSHVSKAVSRSPEIHRFEPAPISHDALASPEVGSLALAPDFTAYLTRSSRVLRISSKEMMEAIKWFGPSEDDDMQSVVGMHT